MTPQDAGARRASQMSVAGGGYPGPDSDRPYDHHEPFCFCGDCLAQKRRYAQDIQGDDRATAFDGDEDWPA